MNRFKFTKYHIISDNRLKLFLIFVFTMISNRAYSFNYNSYEHFSFANCNQDAEYNSSTIFCDIPTGDDGRHPTNISGLVIYSNLYDGGVNVCIKHLDVGFTECKLKFVHQGKATVFESDELNFHWSNAASWGGQSEWWHWVLYLTFPDDELSPEEALRGYKVFYNIP